MNCDTHYGLSWKEDGPPRTSLFERKFKRVRSMQRNIIAVGIFETLLREFFWFCRLSSLFLIRHQNKANSALLKDVTSLYRVDDLGVLNEPDVNLFMNNATHQQAFFPAICFQLENTHKSLYKS